MIDRASSIPDKPGIISDDGAVVSYREFDQRADQFAQHLRDLDLSDGDVIALVAANCPHVYEAQLAGTHSMMPPSLLVPASVGVRSTKTIPRAATGRLYRNRIRRDTVPTA